MVKVDNSKIPAEVTGNCMELDYNLPWSLTSVSTKDEPLKFHPWISDRKGNTLSLDSDCVKFIVNCANRHSKCLDAMLRIFCLCLEEDVSEEPFKSIYDIATAYCYEQLVEDGVIDGEKTSLEDIEESVMSQIGSLSDGIHTYDELYAHRQMLFIMMCNCKEYRDLAWKSRKHDDGKDSFEGYFIAGLTLPTTKKQITYHIENGLWELMLCKELDKAPEWDGHTSLDVEERLFDELDDNAVKETYGKDDSSKGN